MSGISVFWCKIQVITGFMMMAWLTSPAWLGIVVFAVVRRNSFIKSEKIMEIGRASCRERV